MSQRKTANANKNNVIFLFSLKRRFKLKLKRKRDDEEEHSKQKRRIQIRFEFLRDFSFSSFRLRKYVCVCVQVHASFSRCILHCELFDNQRMKQNVEEFISSKAPYFQWKSNGKTALDFSLDFLFVTMFFYHFIVLIICLFNVRLFDEQNVHCGWCCRRCHRSLPL